jgi:hypothetical protein
MSTIQFISVTPDQLQSEINAGVKIILDDFLKNFKPKLNDKSCKRKKEKKMIGVFLSILKDLTVIVRIIDPTLFDNYHYQTIYYLVCLINIQHSLYIIKFIYQRVGFRRISKHK